MEKETYSRRMLSLVESWRSSGMSQADFARENNLSIHTLRYWLYKRGGSSKNPDGFVRLSLPTISHAIKLRYPNGVELHLPPGTPASVVRSFIQV